MKWQSQKKKSEVLSNSGLELEDIFCFCIYLSVVVLK